MAFLAVGKNGMNARIARQALWRNIPERGKGRIGEGKPAIACKNGHGLGHVVERFLRGSPLLAPLLFANVGLMGLLALLDPNEG